MPATPAKVPLILAPTPLHHLHALSTELSLDLWIKRDDLTGFAFGGNKGRKLEYLIADALGQDAEVVVTCGAAQSNFVRQLGAACSMYGLQGAAAVMSLPFDRPAGKPGGAHLGAGGNLILDEILGVDVRLYPDGDWDELYALAEELALSFEGVGRKVYRVPVGGSSPLGALAFYQAAQELNAGPFDWIVVASSSGSTQTGLAYAFDGSSTQVLGIACDPEPEIGEDFAEIGRGLAKLTDHPRELAASDLLLDFASVGEGYGIPSSEGQHAIELVARREGIFLDPVYTGKAFAGLIRQAETGGISGRVLFWHTGGTPALFAAPG
ncbi:MAG: D-cysteine desulfhydrase [Fimbriimonadaceae bacterium]|jgi:D-cysteine desulfhydrase family pyridoxal phosphate-dependent enzyme|nr:D-cysteine desulfhydrase [Fimbriimonadaceae bacterium]